MSAVAVDPATSHLFGGKIHTLVITLMEATIFNVMT